MNPADPPRELLIVQPNASAPAVVLAVPGPALVVPTKVVAEHTRHGCALPT